MREFLHSTNVDRAPIARWLARDKPDLVAVFVGCFAQTVDPAKAKSFVYGLGPSDARATGILFIEANPLLTKVVVVLFEPRPKVRRCREEDWVL